MAALPTGWRSARVFKEHIGASFSSSLPSVAAPHLRVVEADNLGDKIGPARSRVLEKGVGYCDEPNHCGQQHRKMSGRLGHELRLAAASWIK